MSDRPVNLSRSGPPETVRPPQPPEALAALSEALAAPEEQRRAAVAGVVARWPRFLDAWARLAELGRDDVERYARAPAGYHRALDALRGAGWRGSGAGRGAREATPGDVRAP